MSLESLLIQFGYGAILVFMITNGAASYPSSQLLYIIAGYFISTGDLAFLPVLILGALGNTIGNLILYEIAKRKGMTVLERFLFVPQKELRKVQILFNQNGAWFLFVGKLIPAIKALIPIPPGIAGMRKSIFLPIIAITSTIWALPFLGIGYFIGKNVETLGWYAAGVIAITMVFLYLTHRAMNSQKVLEKLEKEGKND